LTGAVGKKAEPDCFAQLQRPSANMQHYISFRRDGKMDGGGWLPRPGALLQAAGGGREIIPAYHAVTTLQENA
jgi:hypothetical protein